MDTQLLETLVDKNQSEFINKLKNWISIRSVSSDLLQRDKCLEMIKLVESELINLGFSTCVNENPLLSKSSTNKHLDTLPPILLASRKVSNEAKTVLIYGHVDVQPAKYNDGWGSEPFELTIKDDEMFGRGASDDKGPVLGWICALTLLYKQMSYFPNLNIKFCIEAMEESGSVGLEELIIKEKNAFFKDVDYIVISDNYWLGTKKPCLTYGLRGIMYYQVEVSGPKQDLHSGLYGGAVNEPMIDLVSLFSQLVSTQGKIMIPAIYDQVEPITDLEKSLYSDIEFDVSEFNASIGMDKTIFNDKKDLLMSRWRYPSLSIHGFEGAFDQPGEKTVIPRKVIGKFSIRMVPNMDVDKSDKIVKNYLNKCFEQLKTNNKLTVLMGHGCPGWKTDFKSINFEAAKRAIFKVFDQEPDYTREGGSIPVAMIFESVLNKNVLLLPMGRSDDGAHSQNEKLNKSNFFNGIKVFSLYLDELSKL